VRLRNTISANSITGYEVYCSVMPDNPYCHIASWGGPNGAYVNMDNDSTALYLKDGDVLEGTVTGTNPVTITMFINGSQVLTVQDTGTYTFSDGNRYGPWMTGSPGFGFYDNQDNNWNWFGFASYTATDGGSGPPSTIAWAAPANIVHGTTLSTTHLNATASVPGTFVHTPAAGTALAAGARQTLSVTFTPTGTTAPEAGAAGERALVLVTEKPATQPDVGVVYFLDVAKSIGVHSTQTRDSLRCGSFPEG
jgi:hypothetical protein